jgi:hypothetical protein
MVLMRRIVVRCGEGVSEDPHEQLIVGERGISPSIDWMRDGMSQISMVVGSILLQGKGSGEEEERGSGRNREEGLLECDGARFFRSYIFQRRH